MDELQYQFISVFIAMTIPLVFVAAMVGAGNSRRIILYFCWGLFAGTLAYNLNNAFIGDIAQQERMALSIAPMIEEVCKMLPILLFLNRKKYPQIPKLLVFCALASGVGFSIQESMYYFAMSARELSDIWILTVRTLTTSLMHGMVTAAFGFGLLLLQKHRQILLPLIFGLLGLCVSIHALFNLLMQTRLAFIAVLMPIAMFFIGWFIIQNTDDGQNTDPNLNAS